jgi:hypothetical protein
MAVVKFWNAGIFFDGNNLTGQTNKVALGRQMSMLDASVFGVQTKINYPGEAEISASISGWWSTHPTSNGYVDPDLFDALSNNLQSTLLVYPDPADLGVAYFFPAMLNSFKFGGSFGEMTAFDTEFVYTLYNGTTRIPECRGVIGLPLTAYTNASTNGSSVQYTTPVGASEFMVMTVHLLTTDATSVTFALESDDAVGFASPTTRITSGAMSTSHSAFHGVVQGPITTDTYYRITATRTGGTTFTAVAAFGRV